jgi:hypothetical protein
MDLAVFQEGELEVALRALKVVALANGSVTERERELLEMLAQLHGRTVDTAALTPITPADVAAAVPGAHARKRLVQLAIITAMTDGEVTREQERAVEAFAQALEIDERGLKVLNDLAGDHLLMARFDLLRRVAPGMFRDVWADEGFRGVAKFVRAVTGHLSGDPELGWRYKQLGLLPKGTLGRTFWEHQTRRKFLLPGELNDVVEKLVYHDFAHVLSGYDTNPEGEAQIAAFLAGNRRNDGFVFFMMIMGAGHLGLKINPNLVAKGLFQPKPVLRALERGAACNVDLTDHFDHWRYVERDLQEVRAELGIPPVASGPGVTVGE